MFVSGTTSLSLHPYLSPSLPPALSPSLSLTDTQYAKSVKINYEIKTDEMLMTKAKPISH